MGVIDVVLSSPIPTVVSVVAAFALGAGHWIYTIPIQAELKASRADLRNKDAQLTEAQAKLERNHTKEFEELKLILIEIRTTVAQNTHTADFDVMQKTIGQIRDKVDGIRGLDDNAMRDLKACMTTLDRNTERVLRTLAEVSEKQSQVSGIILGMSMHGGRSPNGV